MLDVDRFEFLAARIFRMASQQGIYALHSNGEYRERLLRRAALAMESRRLGYMEEEEFYGVIAECCRLGRTSSSVCCDWQRWLLQIEHLAETRQRELFIDSICKRPGPGLRGDKIRHIEFDPS